MRRGRRRRRPKRAARRLRARRGCKAYEPLAAAVLDAAGSRCRSWWPVAYALGRIERSASRAARCWRCSTRRGDYTAAFAARGLGVIKSTDSVAAVDALVRGGRAPAGVAVRRCGRSAQLADRRSGAAARRRRCSAGARSERRGSRRSTALGAHEGRATDCRSLQDLLTDQWPAMRAAAFRAARRDRSRQLSSLVAVGPGAGPHWIVRAAARDGARHVAAERWRRALLPMLQDEDKRVRSGGARRAGAAQGAGRRRASLLEQLEGAGLRRARRGRAGARRAEAGRRRRCARATRIATAQRRRHRSTARARDPRRAGQYGAGEAVPTLKAALADKDWALRVHAAGAAGEARSGDRRGAAIRPAPRPPIAPYDDRRELIAAGVFAARVHRDRTRARSRSSSRCSTRRRPRSNFIALGAQGLLQRTADPPRRAQLRRAGRRSARRRRGRARLHAFATS